MISLAFAIVVTTICEIDGTILTRIFTNNQDVIKNGALYLKTYSIDCLLTSFLFLYQWVFKWLRKNCLYDGT